LMNDHRQDKIHTSTLDQTSFEIQEERNPSVKHIFPGRFGGYSFA